MTTNTLRHRVPSTARRLLLLLFLVAPGLLFGGCGAEERGLVILNPSTDRPYFHDFGKLSFGDKVEHTFQVQNTDSRPVTVQDLQSSCACSAPRISYRDASGELIVGKQREEPVIVLPPGVVADVRIEIDTKHIQRKNIDKLAQLRLRCDSTLTPFITFEMHLLVELAFQATPWTIDLGEVPISAGGQGTSDVVTAIRGQGQRITGVAWKSEGLDAEIEEELRVGETLWKVKAILEPPLNPGGWAGVIRLSTTGPDGAGAGLPFEIPVQARVVPDVVLRPAPLSFGPFSAISGATAEARVVALTPGHRVKVTDARLEGNPPEGLELDWHAVKPDGAGKSAEWNVSIALPPSYSGGRFVGTLVILLDDPSVPRIETTFHFTGG